MASKDYLTIGEVVRKLQVTYPELTVSKVRFLEDEGLVQPDRTGGGYRKFKPGDVERLEAILRMQKMHFYPLSVIRTKLDALDRGEELSELKSGGQEAAANAMQLFEGRLQPLETVNEILSVPVTFVRELAQFGLIDVHKGASGPVVDGAAFPLIQAAWELRSFGIDPRHLRTFATQADREAVLLAQIVAPTIRSKTPDSRKQATETLTELQRLTETLKRSLLAAALAKQIDVTD